MELSVRTRVCSMLGVEYPVFAFTHCREVAAAVSRAGGMGMYGAAYYTPQQVEEDLIWLSTNTDGRPFGVDVMIPSSAETSTESTIEAQIADLRLRIPEQH